MFSSFLLFIHFFKPYFFIFEHTNSTLCIWYFRYLKCLLVSSGISAGFCTWCFISLHILYSILLKVFVACFSGFLFSPSLQRHWSTPWQFCCGLQNQGTFSSLDGRFFYRSSEFYPGPHSAPCGPVLMPANCLMDTCWTGLPGM